MRLCGEVRYIEGSFSEAIALFREALRLVDGDDAAAELQLNLAFAHSILGGATEAAEYAQAAVESATRSGDEALAGGGARDVGDARVPPRTPT